MADDQRTRTDRHRANHPEGDSHRKEKQRQKESVMLFHIKRKHLYGIDLPNHVDTGSEPFKRQMRAFLDEAKKNTETVVRKLK